jgi:hypothetical protein
MSAHRVTAALRRAPWRRLASGLAALAMLALSATAAQAQQPAAKPQCFRLSDWRGWKATADYTAIYIGVGNRRIYRVDFARACTALGHGRHLIHRARGSGSICSAIDLDLRVSMGGRMTTPCPARTLTQLTPEEAAALPKGLRP